MLKVEHYLANYPPHNTAIIDKAEAKEVRHLYREKKRRTDKCGYFMRKCGKLNALDL